MDPYEQFLTSVRERFHRLTTSSPGRPSLFTTETRDLYQVFLRALLPALQQEHTCTACRRFVDRFGGLVLVAPDGATVPALWDGQNTPEPYRDAVKALAAAVSSASIRGVFLSDRDPLGTPRTGEWTHLSVTPGPNVLFHGSALSAPAQVAAEKLQDFQTLSRGLEDFPFKLVNRAYSLLTTEVLFRSEKCIGVARWLLDLHEQHRAARTQRHKDNLTWLAVATAPPGFCHVRSSMIGALLEDLQADLPFAQIKARFAEKMDPLQYQRPTAAPSAGNIVQAEKIMEKLKSAGALSRRFARLADITTVWAPKAAGRKGKGVFSHVVQRDAKKARPLDVPKVVMTWDKFSRTVLPGAERIEYFVPASNEGYLGMVTAKDPDAPPILQWDAPEKRNPVTVYTYAKGSPPERWNLRRDTFHPVSAVALAPWMWGADKSFSHLGEHVVFILSGARDTEYQRGAGFFPEFLKSEYRSVRATLEAHVKDAVVEGKDEAEACGICLAKGGAWKHDFRVTSRGQSILYRLDRWD